MEIEQEPNPKKVNITQRPTNSSTKNPTSSHKKARNYSEFSMEGTEIPIIDLTIKEEEDFDDQHQHNNQQKFNKATFQKSPKIISPKKQSKDTIENLANMLQIDDFNLKLDFKSELKLNSKRRKMKLKQSDVLKIDQLRELRQCISKYHYKKILESLDYKWKFLLKVYIKEYLINDIYNRKLENSLILLNRRKILLESIDDPEILETDCNFDNNSIKNFCKGFVIFYTKNLDDMDAIYENENEGMMLVELEEVGNIEQHNKKKI